MDWKQMVLMIAAVALSANEKTRALVPFIGPAVATAEEMPGKTNPQKLAIVVELVKQGLAATNAAVPGKINVVIADEVIASATSAVVDAANVFHKAGLIVVNTPVLSE